MEDECENLYRRRKPGQKECLQCGTFYNNAAIPEKCKVCDNYLGGKFKPKEEILDAKLLTNNLASVRMNEAGINVRTFVEIGEVKKVSKRFNKKKLKKVFHQNVTPPSEFFRTNSNFVF